MHKGKSFISLGSLVNALQTDTDSTIVLNPKIITQDNRTSTLFVGNNIPFIGSLVTTNSTIVSSSSNIEYRDIGFNLSITPTIGNSDVVTLDISNDISEVLSSPVIGTTSSSGQQNTVTGIQSSHTTMSTRVHVPDKHFVVLTGMITNTRTRFKSGVPCLGGLPVVGIFFQENDRLNSKANIIIFMRPQIVNTYDDYKAVTEGQVNLYKENAVMPVLKEEFDDAIDMVKKSEDE
jgi:type III secretion protein C